MVAVAPAAVALGAEVAGPPGGTDGRKFEQVSPVTKFGYEVGGSNLDGPVHLGVAPSGNIVTYDSILPFEGSESGSRSGYQSTRTDSGWTTVGLTKTHGPNQIGQGSFDSTDALLRGTTPDQATSVYWDCSSAPAGALWIRRASGVRQRIADATIQTTCLGLLSGQPWFLGTSPDGRHIVFSSTSRLGPAVGLAGSARILYEWSDDGSNGGEGTLRVVSRDDSPTLRLLDDTTDVSLGGGMALAGDDPAIDSAQGLRNAVSDGSDGTSRIFFQTNPPATQSTTGGSLYMREDGMRTVEISAPQAGFTPTSPPTATGIRYLDAARDGSRVFFFADGDLVPGAPATGGFYRFDVDPDGAGAATASLRWLDHAAGASFTGLADADGSHFYFSRGDTRLATDSGVRQISRAAVGAGPAANNPVGGVRFSPAEGIRTTQCVSANVSADGRYFAFVNRGDTGEGIGSQVYRYDAEGDGGAGRLELISTSPLAPRPTEYGSSFSGSCRAGRGRPIEKRVMSDDGQYVFFDTGAALVPGDTNGPFGLDAYRWHNGEVALVSGGTGAGYSSFQGTDSSGANAFFTTPDRLVAQDGDAALDLYDSRIGGGFPVRERVGCDGEGCQGAPAQPPGLGVPAGATFVGPGNSEPDDDAAASFSVRAIGRGAIRRLARTGKVTLVVQVNTAGTVNVTGFARIGRVTARVATKAQRARRASTLRMVVRLSSVARRELTKKRRLRVNLITRFSESTKSSKTSLLLRAPRTKGKGR